MSPVGMSPLTNSEEIAYLQRQRDHYGAYYALTGKREYTEVERDLLIDIIKLSPQVAMMTLRDVLNLSDKQRGALTCKR